LLRGKTGDEVVKGEERKGQGLRVETRGKLPARVKALGAFFKRKKKKGKYRP